MNIDKPFNSLYEPMYNLIEDRLELLDKTPATEQGVSQELQPDNHMAQLGKLLLMVQEYLTEEEQTRLFDITCLSPALRTKYVVFYRWYIRWAIDRELP